MVCLVCHPAPSIIRFIVIAATTAFVARQTIIIVVFRFRVFVVRGVFIVVSMYAMYAMYGMYTLGETKIIPR